MNLNADRNGPYFSEQFERGCKVQSGAVKVVNLYGTWREMGRQYGKLLSRELADVYRFADRYIKENGLTAVEVLLGQWQQISYSVRTFMEGVAETSGLTLDQLHRANAVERVSGLPLCSAAFAWDEYAKDKMVIGRNYDYGRQFLELKDDVVVTVYHPSDGTLATATIGYAGEVYAVNAMNERGIFFELNTGVPSANFLPEDARITGTTLLFNMMFEAHSMDYVDAFFNTAKCSESYIVNASDYYGAVSYEWCPANMRKGGQDMPHGLLVSTNHYMNPDWEYPVPTDETSWGSFLRKNNLMQRCQEKKGALDAETMREIISLTEEEGGVTNPMTVYQFVIVPEDGILWLKIIDAADWTEIDLNSFLRNKG